MLVPGCLAALQKAKTGTIPATREGPGVTGFGHKGREKLPRPERPIPWFPRDRLTVREESLRRNDDAAGGITIALSPPAGPDMAVKAQTGAPVAQWAGRPIADPHTHLPIPLPRRGREDGLHRDGPSRRPVRNRQTVTGRAQ